MISLKTSMAISIITASDASLLNLTGEKFDDN